MERIKNILDYLLNAVDQEATTEEGILCKKCAKKALFHKEDLTREELMVVVCGYLDEVGVSEEVKTNLIELV